MYMYYFTYNLSQKKLQIDQILYIKETYILCNNIRKKRKDTKSLYIKKSNSINKGLSIDNAEVKSL